MEKGLPSGTQAFNDAPYERILSPVGTIKGVGKVISTQLRKRGVHTVYDLLYLLPRSYQDRREFVPLRHIKPGRAALIRGKILKISRRQFKHRAILEMTIVGGGRALSARWMGAPLYLFKHKRGEEIILYGQFRTSADQLVTYHPEIIAGGESQEIGGIVPVYPELQGISQRGLRRILRDTVTRLTGELEDPLPARIREEQGLLPLDEAFREVHFPTKSRFEALRTRRWSPLRRLIFDELFMVQLALALRRKSVSQQKGIAFKRHSREELYRLLPFELTGSQTRVIAEIADDMSRPQPMNRLIQGDVGCGKTAVALVAAWAAAKNGYQVAFMAPTQLLAEQHYFSALELMKRMHLRAALLTSGMGARADRIRDAVKQGTVDVLIGTHALIQKSVEFHRLGLAIIDEQHRFGVAQRALLRQKGVSPDLLTMTATPIPRTLGLTLYGDLDISVIDELPVGRKPIRTRLFHERDRDSVYASVREEVSKARQAYMVYPLIEESEKMDLNAATQMAEELRHVFSEFRVAIIHGRMPLEERQVIMEAFKQGNIDILVSTTVIEVGIDVPNATLMVIENAERFGLSQIHQLRGRVGRSTYPSQCLLVSAHNKAGEAGRRLSILEKTTDGFRIAEEDLSIRGPGEFLGVRQSGFLQFRAANLLRDTRILSEARQAAFSLVGDQPELARRALWLFTRLLARESQGGDELADVL